MKIKLILLACVLLGFTGCRTFQGGPVDESGYDHGMMRSYPSDVGVGTTFVPGADPRIYTAPSAP